MTEFTPSKRLLADRDYYRDMADWTPPERPRHMSITCFRGHEYGPCSRPVTHCSCRCHDITEPTESERALFRRLADEIDGFLAAPEQDPLPT